MACLFLLALLWRWAYLLRLSGTPFADSLTADARIFWDWSGRIAREGPLGTQPFFFGPLYPYVLSLFRRLCGDSIGRVLMLQALGGSLVVVLLADAARRLSSPRIGLFIGLLLCFNEMLVFFDGLVLVESLLLLLESLLLAWLVRRAGSRVKLRECVGLGLLVGAIAAGRPSGILLAIPVTSVVLPWRADRRSFVRTAVALAAGLALAVAPIAARNAIVSREWIPLTYSGGFNLFVGSNARATGGWVPVADVDASVDRGASEGGTALDGRDYLLRTRGIHLTASESSRYWAREAFQYARSAPWAVARLTAQKLAMLWNFREYPQIENVEVYRRVAGPLGPPWIGGFALLGILGLAALPRAWAIGDRGRFLIGYVVTVSLGTMAFFVTDRYRVHLIPGVALLAAVALADIGRTVTATNARTRTRLVVSIAIAASIVFLPLPHLSAQRRAWGVNADVGSRWLEHDRADLALPYLAEAARIEAREVHGRGPGLASGRERARLHLEYGLALERNGRVSEALRWLELAARELPENPSARLALSNAYRAAGRGAAADAMEAGTASTVATSAILLSARALRAAQSGDITTAAALFRAATEADPRDHSAWGSRIRAQLQLGQIASAESSLALARGAGLPSPDGLVYEAAIRAVSGDLEGARRALERVPKEALQRNPTLNDVVVSTRRILGSLR